MQQAHNSHAHASDAFAGGSSVSKAAEALKRHGPGLIVATPGRLLTVLSKRAVMLKPRCRPRPGGEDTLGSVTLVLEEVSQCVQHLVVCSLQ